LGGKAPLPPPPPPRAPAAASLHWHGPMAAVSSRAATRKPGARFRVEFENNTIEKFKSI
jgi:hypothetical protein